MDVPVAFRWVFAALAALQLIALIPVLRRLRAPGPGTRTEARFTLLDAACSLTAFAGIAFGNLALMLCGLTALGLLYAVKGIRWYRTRERA
ncbi:MULTISPECIES: hypothetical protein [unclassified Streptomyces]|uniref:hypothetical protein n=1 Tax=unclassified Streptomyces TaxID=2593676 RepID=UPI0006B06AD5|nr:MULTISPECIES: hypothetical protein [unclassified Streptomyces]